MELEANPDILRSLGQNKRDHQTLIGFAAENRRPFATGEPQADGKAAGPRGGQQGERFPAAASTRPPMPCWFWTGNGRVEHWPELPKTEVAWRIWDHLQHL
jgi:phosphopantothenoylcysteine decarboxylase/phosphopantothenate--cysteine ligase